MYSISDIQQIVSGKFLSEKNGDAKIEHFLTDSRKLLFPETTLFFALHGLRRNGNGFVHELYEKGVRNFLVEENFSIDQPEFAEINLIQVASVQKALQKLAAHHRQQFNYPVIGITGSNGKTIVKEWLYQLLQYNYNIVRSPKSYNSQIGVPLSVWQMSAANDLAIFEAGISQSGEMQRLKEIINPAIGIFTNIGEAHNEGFENIARKIEEKLKLFQDCETVIYCMDDIAIHNAMLQMKSSGALFTWSKSQDAVLTVTAIQVQAFNTVIKAVFKENKISISIPFTNDAAIENAITCWCLLLHLGMDNEYISERMLDLKPVEMRLELKQANNNCSLINDSYSADITSLSIALDFLQQQQQHPKRTVIISDILQTGKTNTALYKEVANILEQKNIHRLIGIGPEIIKNKDCFGALKETSFFNSTLEFKQQFPSLHFYNETILLKGARIFEFEQISHLLEQKSHQTVLEINLNAIAHNLKTYQLQLNEGVKIMAMVKAFSYGSGSFEIANLLQFHKVDYLAVAYSDEGVELRKAGIRLPIMVMNAEVGSFDLLVQHNLEPELYSFGILTELGNYLLQNGITNFPVHIKLDTGMHRLGFEITDIPMLVEKLKASHLFKIQSVFSHLVASENEVHDLFTQEQANVFIKANQELERVIRYPYLKHIANTSAIHRHKNLQFEMVRLGIGLYGVDSNEIVQGHLRNVSTLKTTISQIKKVKPGESVGYSRNAILDREVTIATVRIGYADGYPRSLGNGNGKMLVQGRLTPVIGNVCMDMTMLDITGIDVKEGDEVIVFGEHLPVNILAVWSETIPYEILTGISQRVKRVYFEE